MYVVVLMAGAGTRFSSVAQTNPTYRLPKPLIPVQGQAILERTTRSLPFIRHFGEHTKVEPIIESKLVFAIRTIDEEHHQIKAALRKMYGDRIKLITFNRLTRGNLETAFISTEGLNENEELLILDSDNAYDGSNFADHLASLKNNSEPPKAVVCCFDPIDKNPKWCFAMMNEQGRVSGLLEKDETALSLGGKPMIGTFYFDSVKTFRNSALDVMNAGQRTGFKGQEEFYLSQGVQNLIKKGAAVYGHVVPSVDPLGTPEDVEHFISKQKDPVTNANLH